MIPRRFSVEYPERCLMLLDMLEAKAREQELVGSFSLLAASAVLVIPYERMRSRHPLHRKERDSDLSLALRSLEKEEKFVSAPFWQGEGPANWRFSRIVTDPNRTAEWRDEEGNHPMSPNAKNTLAGRKAGQVIRVLRNALAHGNIVYLDSNGAEEVDAKVRYIAFLSRYEENEEQQQKANTYRVVTMTEDEFLRFVKRWAQWISQFRYDASLDQAA